MQLTFKLVRKKKCTLKIDMVSQKINKLIFVNIFRISITSQEIETVHESEFIRFQATRENEHFSYRSKNYRFGETCHFHIST